MPGPYKVKMDGSLMLLQPSTAAGEHIDSLFIDMKQGTISHHRAQRLPEDSPGVLGVIGFVRLRQGAVVCLVAKAKRVTCAEDGVYHIKETRLIAHEGVKSDDGDVRHAALLQEALDPSEGAGRHMYFSYNSCITASAQLQQQQQQAAHEKSNKGKHGGSTKSANSSTCWHHWNKTYVWNAGLLQPLIDAGAHAFATPIMVGYMGQVYDVVLPCLDAADGTRSVKLTLTSRLDAQRAGTIAWRSGCDTHGACAHMVETELRLEITHSATTPVSAAAHSSTAKLDAGVAAAKDASAEEDLPDVAKSPTAAAASTSPASTPVPVSTPAAPSAPAAAPAAVASNVGKKPLASASKGTTSTFALTQLRGSIPGLWAATPDLSTCPNVRLCADSQQQAAAVAAHFKQLHQEHQRVIMAHIPGAGASECKVLHALDASLTSLINSKTATPLHGDDGSTAPALSSNRNKDTSQVAIQQEVMVLVGNSDGRLFVVHGKSGSAASGGKLEQAAAMCLPGQQNSSEQLLWQLAPRRRLAAELAKLVQGHGHYEKTSQAEGNMAQQWQSGVIRLCCGLAGTLDLTNLLQAEIALEWLEGMLRRERMLGEGHTLQSHHPSLAIALNSLWANQGNVLADQMTAGGCASAAVIKAHGQMPSVTSKAGVHLMRAARFYTYNFNEAQHQDCCDLLTGAYKIDPGVRPAGRGSSTYSSLQLFMICSGWAVVQAVLSWLSTTPVEPLTVLYRVGAPAAAALLLLAWLWSTRATYCSRPLLAPQHVLPWDAGQRL